jgi:hypothetical protein
MKKLFSTTFVFILALSSLFAQNLIVSNDSGGANVCTGSAYFLDSTALNTSIVWMNNGTVIQQGGYNISNLCPGTYTVTYSVNGMTFTETFIIGEGTANPCSNFVATVVTTPVSQNTACDGTAEALVSGGTAPYAYNWSNGQTGNPLSNLCAGLITVSVTDANGCSWTYTAIISGDNQNQDSTIVIDNSGGANGDGDLGNSLYEDCDLLLEEFETIYANGYNYQTGDTVIVVYWLVVDANGNLIDQFATSYGASSNLNGTYVVTTTIICEGRSGEISSIEVRDLIQVQSTASLFAYTPENLVVVNPFADELVVYFNEIHVTYLTLVDVTGKLVWESEVSNQTIVNPSVADLGQGVYMLQVKSDKGMISRRLIKQ